MKSDFLLAITQLAAEKNLSREVVLGAVEAALVSAYRKDSFAATQNIEAKIDPISGRVKVWAEKTVTNKPEDRRREISLVDARKINAEAELDDLIMVEDTPHNAGRIVAQTAKQVILQRLHEAEHGAIFDEYAGKEGDIVSATIERVESKQVLVDLGRGEAIMPLSEQMPTERYRSGQRLKVFLVEVARTAKGPLLVVSRSHPNLLRRLFELEVPEVFNGIVEIKSVAREAGYRSKVAVVARQTGIDPVGCCVGLRGIRIQNIVNELSGEKIDVVAWDEDPATFIASALSPAHVVRVELDEAEQSARVIIPDKQLSLAIGKVGQNVRLAVKLSGWRIDIKSATEADAEAAEAGETAEEAVKIPEAILLGEEPTVGDVEKTVDKEEEGEAITITTLETPATPEAATAGKAALRFAEDLRPVTSPQVEVKTKKKKKKKTLGKDSAQDGIKLKKRKRGATAEIGDEEEYI
jgi:N utilization substance protein A